MPDTPNDFEAGYLMDLGRAKVLIEQELANGLPQPEVDEPTRKIEWPHDHDPKPLDENA